MLHHQINTEIQLSNQIQFYDKIFHILINEFILSKVYCFHPYSAMIIGTS